MRRCCRKFRNRSGRLADPESRLAGVAGAGRDPGQYAGWLDQCHYRAPVTGVETTAGLATALGWLQRFGPAALLLSWVPVVGDLLCVLAGWLRMPRGSVALFLCIGKALRYIVLAMITVQGIAVAVTK